MRLLVLDTYYERFLREHYGTRPSLVQAPYEEQLDSLMSRSFGTSDAYSHYLRSLGHEAAEVVVNCVPLQERWAADHGLRSIVRPLRPLLERRGRVFTRLSDALHRIMLAQVESFRPDVVYLQDVAFHTTRQVRDLRGRNRLLVGQLASKAPAEQHLRAFDLITTSFPHFVGRLRAVGIDSEYFRIGFDARVLARLEGEPQPARSDVVFVGGLDPQVHGGGVRLLERICTELPGVVDVYGYGSSGLPRGSSIRARYRGEAWGLDMYRALAGAKIALNRHIDIAEGHSNNMRLYEATGVGAALLTDEGHNLHELFEPQREVVTYRGAEDAVAVTRSLLEDEGRCARIAAAGQERTLAVHTYAHRMAELAEILRERLARRRR